MAEEAYSHEVASFGFWPGSKVLPEPAFYAYLYPNHRAIKAYCHDTLREFILLYSAVQQSNALPEMLSELLNSTMKLCDISPMGQACIGNWQVALSKGEKARLQPQSQWASRCPLSCEELVE